MAVRARTGVGILETDRPIPPEALGAIEGTGARIRVASRWLRAVSVEAAPETARRLRRLPQVDRIVPVAVLERPVDSPSGRLAPARLLEAAVAAAGAGLPIESVAVAGPLPGSAARDTLYGMAAAALQQIAVPEAHQLGFTGAGVRIAVLDAGFTLTHESLASVSVVAAYDFIHGDTIVSDRPGEPSGGALHGARTLSILAGNAPGRLVGPAPAAEFLLAKVDRRQAVKTTADEDRWVAALEWADSLGARIVHSSLGYRAFSDRPSYTAGELDGQAAVSTRAAREAALRGILVVSAVGDGGPLASTLVAPADGADVLAVGAADTAGRVTSFSARGPTGDGRFKPDLIARGAQVAAAGAAPASYDQVSGTDRAAALVTGAAALVLEAWPELTGTQVRDALARTGSLAAAPNHVAGRGIPDATRAVVFPDGIRPLPPVGVDPAGTFLTLAPTFVWDAPRIHPAAGRVRFVVEVATDDRFQNVVFTDSVADGFDVTMSRPLRPRPTLWWRIAAETEAGVRRVTGPQGPLHVPPWVQLRSLNRAPEQFTSATRPRLVWSALAAPPPIGPLTYDVQVLSAHDDAVLQNLAGIRDTTVTVPEPLAYNTPYRWRVIARSRFGVADTVESVAPFVVTSTSHPPATLLYQNFPNHFPRPDLGQSATRIWFDLDQRTFVELGVYDLRGRLVRRLIPAHGGCGIVVLPAGLYGRDPSGNADDCLLTHWDGRDDAGRTVPQGVYVLRLTTLRGHQTRQMLFLPDG